MQVGQRAAQPVVAGRVQHRLVKDVVRVRPVLDRVRDSIAAATPMLVQLVDRAPEENRRLVQARELLLLDPLGSELRPEALELRANLVRLADLPRGRPADDRASVRLQLDDAVRLELAQRLAHRRAADLELRGQRLLA